MRQVQIHDGDLLSALAADAEAGKAVELVRDGQPVAQIIPFPARKRSRESHMAALARLDALMEKGYDMGLVWNGRDELYDRHDD